MMFFNKIKVTPKQIGIGTSVILFIGIILISISYLNFRNSWRYTRYQIALANKYKNPEVVMYFDCEKISDNNLQRKIWQAKNLDEALDRPHDDSADMIAYQFYNSNKEIIVKNLELGIKHNFEFAPDTSTQTSDLKLFWKVFRNQPISTTSFQVKKLSSQKVETTDTNNNDDDDITIVYEKINKQWKVTDFY
uniref:DUF4829 domain-containing protein n=1 Tax=Dulem virus 31 TaxID=3145749 RepID=A0AAU8ATA1_9VIRU